MTTAGVDPITLTRDGIVCELLPASAGHRLVFVRVRADGSFGGVIDAPVVGQARPVGVFLQACGASVWATAASEDGTTQWLVRMDRRLAEVELASFVVSPGVDGFTEIGIRDVACSDGRLHFTMRHAGVLAITPPVGAVVTLTSDVYDVRVVDAGRLFDAGRVPSNAVGRDHEIQEMWPGANGGLLMSIAGVDDGGTSVARFDAADDTFTTLGVISLSSFVTAMAEADDGEQLACLRRPNAGTLEFGGALFPDADADSICVLRNGTIAVPIELRTLVKRAFFDAETLWLSGRLYESDPLLGDGSVVAPLEQPPYLVGLDRSTRTVVARAHWSEAGLMADVGEAFPARPAAGCGAAPEASAAMLLSIVDPQAGSDIAAVETTSDHRLVLAGTTTTACTSTIATWHRPLFVEGEGGTLALSPTPATDCAHTRYLAAIPDGRLVIQTATGEQSATGTPAALDLVVFSPSECMIERR